MNKRPTLESQYSDTASLKSNLSVHALGSSVHDVSSVASMELDGANVSEVIIHDTLEGGDPELLSKTGMEGKQMNDKIIGVEGSKTGRVSLDCVTITYLTFVFSNILLF